MAIVAVAGPAMNFFLAWLAALVMPVQVIPGSYEAILAQFLIEAVTLSLIGGAIGVLVLWSAQPGFVDDQGAVYDVTDGRPLLDESDLFAKLTNAGYGGVNDIEREGAIFTADAYDKSGNKVELTISAYDGHVIHEERDDD